MKLHKVILVLSLALVVMSCGSLSKGKAYTVDTQLELTMDNLVCLGESEISVDYSTYLGMFDRIEKINGEVYDPVHVKKLAISQQGLNLSETGMEIAAYKLVEDYPTATYFQIVYRCQSKERLFLGSTVHSVAKVRAYRFK